MLEEGRGIEEQLRSAQEKIINLESDGMNKDDRIRDLIEERMKEQEEPKKEITEGSQTRIKLDETMKVF